MVGKNVLSFFREEFLRVFWCKLFCLIHLQADVFLCQYTIVLWQVHNRDVLFVVLMCWESRH